MSNGDGDDNKTYGAIVLVEARLYGETLPRIVTRKWHRDEAAAEALLHALREFDDRWYFAALKGLVRRLGPRPSKHKEPALS